MASVPRLLAAASGVVLEVLAVVAIAFTVGRAAYYPFWAAQATHAELARSWGGPGPVGATLAHWAVAVLTIVVASGLFLVARRIRLRSLK